MADKLTDKLTDKNASLGDDGLIEKTAASQEIYDGVVLHVFRDDILLPNGKHSIREYAKHNGAVCVVPITDNGEVLCVKQYRYAHQKVLLEIPAGKLDSPDEDHLSAALRELREETGAVPERIEYLGAMIPSPALIGETIYMYMARGLTVGETDFDEDEFLELVKIPLRDMVDMIMRGEIEDGKTQAAILKAYMLLEQEKRND